MKKILSLAVIILALVAFTTSGYAMDDNFTLRTTLTNVLYGRSRINADNTMADPNVWAINCSAGGAATVWVESNSAAINTLFGKLSNQGGDSALVLGDPNNAIEFTVDTTTSNGVGQPNDPYHILNIFPAGMPLAR